MSQFTVRWQKQPNGDVHTWRERGVDPYLLVRESHYIAGLFVRHGLMSVLLNQVFQVWREEHS